MRERNKGQAPTIATCTSDNHGACRDLLHTGVEFVALVSLPNVSTFFGDNALDADALIIDLDIDRLVTMQADLEQMKEKGLPVVVVLSGDNYNLPDGTTVFHWHQRSGIPVVLKSQVQPWIVALSHLLPGLW